MRIKTCTFSIWAGFVAFLVVSALGPGSIASAWGQDRRPIVHFSVTWPDGRTDALNAPESGVARAAAKTGTEYGFRPTMLDDEGAQVVITIFDMGNASAPVHELGEVQLRKGGSATTSKTTPAFRIKLDEVSRVTT